MDSPGGFWHGRRVLVTGVGGFVGSRLAEELVARGARVSGIVRDSRGEALLEALGLGRQVELVRGSLSDYPLVERALNEYEVDTCFHLAAQAIVLAANRSPLSTFESNIRGTWHLLEACRQSRTVQAVVVASTDKVYGDQPQLPYTEESPLAARYPYDASKLCADLLARCYSATYSLPVAVSRCANLYGGGDLNWSRLIPGTIRSVLLGEAPVVRSDGTLERDYLYVADAVAGFLALAEGLHRGEAGGECFNFGSGQPLSALAVVERILAVAGARDLKPRILGQAPAEIRRQYLASDKARAALGWGPRVGLEEGLRLSLAWYSEYLRQQPPRRGLVRGLVPGERAAMEAKR